MMARSGSGGGRHERAESVLGVQSRTYRWSVVLTIDPDQAKQLLASMPRQRDLRESNVQYFVDALENKRMLVTHQGIACGTDGQLIDGQHRLTAVVRTGIPLTTEVTFNLDRTIFEAVDRGLKRSLIDDFVLTKLVSAKTAENVVAAMRIIFHVDHGRVPWSYLPKLNLTELGRGLELHPTILDVDNTVRHSGNSARIPRGPLTAFGTLFHEVDPSMADSFLVKVLTGIELEPGEPVLALRNGVIKRTGRHARRSARNDLMVKIVKAWNAAREGRKLRHLSRGMLDGTEGLSFPTIHGYTPRPWS